MLSHFTHGQILPLYVSVILFIVSVCVMKRRLKFSLACLTFGTLALGYFMAQLDPFLMLWDEQYHALVAKNLVHDFLQPKLYLDPVLEYSYKNWTANHIWLHKPPLFLWQMALSIKLFGANEFAVRLPSVIMHGIVPLFIFRIGKLALNKQVGFLGALMFAVAYFPLELVSGRVSTDHNDLCFLFFVLGSFWSWFEFQNSEKKYWPVVTGIAAGAAVLVKWYLGLMVFGFWFLSLVLNQKKLREYSALLVSFGVSVLMFLPWQLYIYFIFPEETIFESQKKSEHFFTAIESHQESTWFYFGKGLKQMYGSGYLVPVVLSLGFILLILKVKSSSHRIFILGSVVSVYAFFTIAATKMVSFVVVVSPFVFLGLSVLVNLVLDTLETWIKKDLISNAVRIVVSLFIAFSLLNLKKIAHHHTNWKPYDNNDRVGELKEMRIIRDLKNQLDPKAIVFYSAKTLNGHISLMFYTDFTAYKHVPSSEEIKRLKKLKRKVAVVNFDELPQYITNDPYVQVLYLE